MTWSETICTLYLENGKSDRDLQTTLFVGNVFHKKTFQIFQHQVKTCDLRPREMNHCLENTDKVGEGAKHVPFKKNSNCFQMPRPQKVCFLLLVALSTLSFVLFPSILHKVSSINPRETIQVNKKNFILLIEKFILAFMLFVFFPETFISASFKGCWRCRFNNQQVSKIHQIKLKTQLIYSGLLTC